MGFDQSKISYVDPPIWTGSDLRLKWAATTPGLTWQIYLNHALATTTTKTQVMLPWPTADVQIDIGSVDPSEANEDFSADLPVAPPRRASLQWLGGTFQAADISGFLVYEQQAVPNLGVPDAFIPNGPAIEYEYNLLDDIPAYVGGFVTDGFGLGGFGQGGFGLASSSYSWTSDPLSSGTWTFAVRPYDKAGNLGPLQTYTVTIACPPEPPAPFAGTMQRLHYAKNPSDSVTLTWNPTPSSS